MCARRRCSGISFARCSSGWCETAAHICVPHCVVLGLLAVQMTIGETQYRTHLPWWLVLVHVTVAASVWAALTAFVVRLWRPAGSA